MRKIPSVFVRDPRGRRKVTPEVTEGCEWVLAGEGMATRKWDGTACAIIGGRLYKRKGAKKCNPPPEGFAPAEARPEFHWLGWVPVGDGPEDRYHREAWAYALSDWTGVPEDWDGTYELIGSRVQGGAEVWFEDGELDPGHYLIPHGTYQERCVNRSFEGIRDLLATLRWEGIVFHHPDGRMAKVKRKDFGLPWPLPTLQVMYVEVPTPCA